MKRAMTVTYEVEDSLYINITNRCSNRCDFCIRNNGEGAYGSDSLWLEREPSVSEVLDSLLDSDLTKYREIVFCGYGEPTYRLQDCREIALALKKRVNGIKIRINTNGQAGAILGMSCAELFRDAFDTVSVSLNAPNAERYDEICHPVYGFGAFYVVLAFIKDVKKCVQNVQVTAVREFLTDNEVEECKKIARDLGVPIRIRDYIS